MPIFLRNAKFTNVHYIYKKFIVNDTIVCSFQCKHRMLDTDIFKIKETPNKYRRIENASILLFDLFSIEG